MNFNYFMMALSDLVVDGEQKNWNSWALIYFTCSIIFYNFSMTIKRLVQKFLAKQRILYYEKRLKRRWAKLGAIKRQKIEMKLSEHEDFCVKSWKWHRASKRAGEARFTRIAENM